MGKYVVKVKKKSGKVVNREVEADSPDAAEDAAVGSDSDTVLGVKSVKSDKGESEDSGDDSEADNGGKDSEAEGKTNGDEVEIISVEEVEDGEGTEGKSGEETAEEPDDKDEQGPEEEHPWFKDRFKRRGKKAKQEDE